MPSLVEDENMKAIRRTTDNRRAEKFSLGEVKRILILSHKIQKIYIVSRMIFTHMEKKIAAVNGCYLD